MNHFSSNGINVLPPKLQKNIRGAYYLHLATVAFLAFAVVFAAGSLFLLPSYFLARDHASAAERFRGAIAGTIDLKEAKDIEQEAARLGERIRIGNEIENAAAFTALMDALGEVPLGGISLTDISLIRKGADVSVHLAGVSETREALLLFAEALKASGSFTNIELPVAQLISDEDISFSVGAGFVKK